MMLRGVGEGQVSGPMKMRAVEPETPQIDPATGLDLNKRYTTSSGSDVRRERGLSVLLEERRRGEAMPGGGTPSPSLVRCEVEGC